MAPRERPCSCLPQGTASCACGTRPSKTDGPPGTFRHHSRDGPYIHVRMAQPWEASLVVSTREMLSPWVWPSSVIDGLTFVARTRQASCDCVAQTLKSGPSLHAHCTLNAQSPDRGGPVEPAGSRQRQDACFMRFPLRRTFRTGKQQLGHVRCPSVFGTSGAETRFWFADSIADGERF